jgi:amidase
LGGRPDPDVTALIEQTARICAGLGHHVEIVSTSIDRPALRAAILTLWPYLGGELVDFYSALNPDVPIGDLLEPWTLGLAKKREEIEPFALADTYKAIVLGEQAIATFHEDWDVILSPVTRDPPLPLGVMAPTRPFDELWTTLFEHVDYTPIHNLLGVPSVTLPLGMTADGLPVGSLFSAAQGQDELLLALAAEIEAATPWADRWPPDVPAATPAPVSA